MQARDGLTKALVGLIVLATVAFAIGAAVEKSQHHEETTSTALVTKGSTIPTSGGQALLASETPAEHAAESGGQTTQTSPDTTGGSRSESQHSGESPAGTETTPNTSGESATQHAAEGGSSETAAEHAGEIHSEKLLGLDPEATGLVVVAVLTSLLLALAVWFRPGNTLLLLIVAAAMLLFAALDIREAIHQSDESNSGLVVLASLIAAIHLAAGSLALYLARLRSTSVRPA
jgi:hypothetical protein